MAQLGVNWADGVWNTAVWNTAVWAQTASPPSTLELTAILPSSGVEAGGMVVMLVGVDFDNGATCTIDGNNAPVTYVNSTTLYATVPAGTAGAVDVVVTNLDASTDTLAGGFTYTVAVPGAYSGGNHAAITLGMGL